MPNVKVLLSGCALVCLTNVGVAEEPKLRWIKDLHDVQLYLKPKYDLIRTFDQEFGVQATMARYGNLAEITNICYDPVYPVEFNRRPRFSMAFAFTYFLTPLPWRVGIYTKPKYNLINQWKEETGVTARFYTSRSLWVSGNLAYVFNYPYVSGTKPNWLALVNFQFPLR